MKYSIQDTCKSTARGSHWRKVRNNHIMHEHYCQCCGREDNLEVHHIVPWNTGIDRYELNNLVTLCRHCHFRFGHLSNWRDINSSLKDALPFTYTHFVKPTRTRRKWYK
jgi:hypothetical protein